MKYVAHAATIIKATTPTRSDHRARLKNSHHKRISTPPAIGASTATRLPPSETSGAMIRMSTVSAAIATPGQSLRFIQIASGAPTTTIPRTT